MQRHDTVVQSHSFALRWRRCGSTFVILLSAALCNCYVQS